MSQQLANSAALRTQQKKILLLEGALHRLALVESVANLKAGVRANSVFGLIEPATKRRLLLDTVLPVLLSVLPMLAGSARLPRLLRRMLVAAGVGATVVAMLRRQRGQAEGEGAAEAVGKT